MNKKKYSLMEDSTFVCPYTGENLFFDGNNYYSESGKVFHVKNNIPRFCSKNNYSESFGFQWNIYRKTQLDSFSNFNLSSSRFWATTNWNPSDLKGKKILEAGSGAGRFTEVFLNETNEILYSMDYSSSVDANFKNNYLKRSRLKLIQASIYEMPFRKNTFDKIFCFGVLQHTPSFKKSIFSLVSKLKKDGELVVDFYPIKGFWTKIHSKYLLRPITKIIPKKILLFIISITIEASLFLYDVLTFFKISILTRFLFMTDVSGFPKNLSRKERKQWAILDTFDAFSPEFDNPQQIKSVIQMFIDAGCKVNFSGIVNYEGGSTAVVRGVKI